MELWATGFNAWNQLSFDGESQDEPEDLSEFTCVLKDELIEILRTSLSAVIVKTTSGPRTAGSSDKFAEICSDRKLFRVAIAGNDKISEISSTGITQYESLQAFTAEDGVLFKNHEDIIQIAANQTSFTALSSNGTVFTWGDRRYEACLGREVTDESPAFRPCIVEELSDLPDKVVKIASGGYATAVLTAGNDIYTWGRQGHPELSEPLTGSPTPLDLDGFDFQDVAVGMNHIIALTTEHRVVVVGAGDNGQLGLGTAIQKLGDWREVILPLSEGQRVLSVHAGYKNSFVIVQE